jgi:hypothetical protein
VGQVEEGEYDMTSDKSEKPKKQKPKTFVGEQNFLSTEGIPHKQHKARNVQLPPKGPTSQKGK